MQTITILDVLNSIDGGLLAEKFGTCMYSYESRKRCVIGCAMTDETIEAVKKKNMNHMTIDELVSTELVHVLQNELGDMSSLQAIFDGSGSKSKKFKYKVKLLRDRYGFGKERVV